MSIHGQRAEKPRLSHTQGLGQKHRYSSYEKRDRWKRTTSSGGISYRYFLTGERNSRQQRANMHDPKINPHAIVEIASL